MIKRSSLLAACVVASGVGVVSLSYAEGATLHLESVITGNQEQPTVLFVMPWQPLREPQLNEGELPSEMPTRLMQSYTPEAFTRLVGRPGVVTNAFTLPSGEANNGDE